MAQSTHLSNEKTLYDIHDALENVRSRPEFQPAKDDNFWRELSKHPMVEDLRQKLDEILQAIGKLFNKAFSGFKLPELDQNAPIFDQVFAYTLYGLITLFALFILFLVLSVIRRYWGSLQANQKTEGAQTEPLQTSTSAKHITQARQALQSQEYDEAVRHLYLASLCLLDEKRVVAYQPNRSNLEYILSLRRARLQSLLPYFQSVSRQFERSHYGQHPAGLEDCKSCDEALQGLSQTLKTLPAQAPSQKDTAS